MNRYRVTVVTPSSLGGNWKQSWDVEASTISTAVGRTLRKIRDRDDLSVRVQLLARNVVRPRSERQSHGRVLESPAS